MVVYIVRHEWRKHNTDDGNEIISVHTAKRSAEKEVAKLSLVILQKYNQNYDDFEVMANTSTHFEVQVNEYDEYDDLLITEHEVKN